MRRIYNIKFDRHPAVIVHCTSVGDVRHAVTFARDHAVPLSVRCGGHSYAGYGLNDGGVVIDLSGLRSITVASNRKSVCVGGGTLVGAIDATTAPLGLATVLGQCPSVGIGGYTLGGGVGPLMSEYGLSCDNLLSADLVLADGSIVTASTDENSDLFWAIRGGGGNFGVATSLTLKLHKVTNVLGGDLVFRADQPGKLLRAFQAYAKGVPDELTLIAEFVPGQGGKPIFVVQACYVGDEANGKRVLAPLRASPFLVADTVIWQPYLKLQQSTPGDIPPQMHENRGGLFADMNDQVIARMTQMLATAPANFMFSFIHTHGAVTRVAPAATACAFRRKGWGWSLSGFWQSPADRESVTAWVKTSAAALAPFGAGAYVNVMDAEDDTAVRAAYGQNYSRLAVLKQKYDPSNLFALNQNIKPQSQRRRSRG
ncbi:MAG: FAD-binding oxidoreductase [Rhodanobacter sp.]